MRLKTTREDLGNKKSGKEDIRERAKLPKLPIVLLIPALLFVPGLYLVLLSAVALTIIIGIAIIYLFFIVGLIPVDIVFLIGIGVLIGVYASFNGLYQTVFKKKHFEQALIVDMEKEQDLSNFVEDLCERMETKVPEVVLLHFGPTFFVQQGKIKVINGIAKRRILAIGLPLLSRLTVDEFRAILAHEFAHFTGRDTLYSSVVSPVYVGTITACEEMKSTFSDESEGSIFMSIPLMLPYAMLRIYLSLFKIIDGAISRSRETRADLMATHMCGQAVFGTALRTVVREGIGFEALFPPKIPEEQMKDSYINYCDVFRTFLNQNKEDLEKFEQEAMEKKRELFDRHPTLKTRLSNLPEIPDQFEDNRNARELLKSPNFYEEGLSKFVFRTPNLFEMESVKKFDEILVKDPDDVFVLNKKAVVMTVSGQYNDALECCERAIKIDPNQAFAWNLKGGVHHIMKNYQNAMDCFDTASKINPKLSDVWQNIGATYYMLEEYQKAIECFDRAIKNDRDYEQAWNGKGLALQRINQERKAAKCFKKVEKNWGRSDSVALTFRLIYSDQLTQKYALQKGKVMRVDEQQTRRYTYKRMIGNGGSKKT